MGFSVTAANVIFAVALLGALSVASAEYWRTTETVTEARRAHDERVLAEAHAEITLSDYNWNNGAKTLDFRLTNTGTTGLNYTKFRYMFDGVVSFATQENTYPRLNGATNPTSNLLLPGDTLDCKFALASQPASVQVVTEYGSVYARYP